MGKRFQLHWDCEEQLFKKEMGDADDIRLSVRLLRKCMADKRRLCGGVPPGNAMAKSCLEEHREELTEGCREEIDAMIERRAGSFLLNSRLRKFCRSDIFSKCLWLGDNSGPVSDGDVVTCLQVGGAVVGARRAHALCDALSATWPTCFDWAVAPPTNRPTLSPTGAPAQPQSKPPDEP
jgi:hypothetical protein